MKFFKKPAVAVMCAMLIVLISTIVSVKVSFEKRTHEVVDGFYGGELYNGVTETSIYSHLLDICTNAEGIIKLANSYGIDTEEAKWSIEDLEYSTTEWYDDISYIHFCYEQILENVNGLNKELYAQALTAVEQQELSTLNWIISERVSDIDASGYNESVRLFIREVMHFPTDFLCDLAGVYPPDYFG